MQPGTETLSLEQVVRVLRRRLPLVGVCVLLVSLAAYAFSRHQAKEYTATASLAFQSNSLARQAVGLPAAAASASGLLSEHANNVDLVRLGDVAAKTASVLGHGLTRDAVATKVSVSGRGESNIVAVSAAAGSAALAAQIANTYAQEFVTEQRAVQHAYLTSALSLVDSQVAALPAKQRAAALGVALQSRAETLALLADLNDGGLRVAQQALAPSGPSAPKTLRNTILGALLGLFVGLGLAFVRDSLDRRLHDPRELAAIYRLPLLGTVPRSSALSRSSPAHAGALPPLPPAAAEAFNLIRAHLRSFNAGHQVRTVLIASAARGEGKTTIARHLAEAAARAGARALLIEADMRDPMLARRLGIDPAPGLAELVSGAASIEQASRPLALKPASPEAATCRTLDVLVAGSAPPSGPAELLESDALAALLRQARSSYDLVVVDAPPLTTVSDAFPLLRQLDGVLVLGRVRGSRRDAAERLREVLASSGVAVLGLVANGLKSNDRGYYARSPAEGASAPLAPTNHVSQAQELVSTSNL